MSAKTPEAAVHGSKRTRAAQRKSGKGAARRARAKGAETIPNIRPTRLRRLTGRRRINFIGEMNPMQANQLSARCPDN